MKKTKESDNEIAVTVKRTQPRFANPLEAEIVSDKKVNLTKEKAFEFLEMKTFEGERQPRDMHVQHLYDEFVAGRFMWHHVIIGSCELNGDTYRVNGQHTCWMRVNLNEAHEPVKADVREIVYKVKDNEQLRALYSTFDRNATRTTGHISTVLLMSTEAGAEIPHSMIRNILAGFRLFESPDWRITKRPTELVELVKSKHAALFNTVGRFMNTHIDEHPFVKRAAVVGAVFATFSKGVEKGAEFWKPVFTGLGLESKTDPRHKLREFMQTHGHGPQRGKFAVSAEQQYRVCINAWNTWRSNEPLKNIKVISSTDSKRATVKD